MLMILDLLVAAVLIWGFWMLIRELNLWYWKVNHVVSLLEDIRDYLKILAG